MAEHEGEKKHEAKRERKRRAVGGRASHEDKGDEQEYNAKGSREMGEAMADKDEGFRRGGRTKRAKGGLVRRAAGGPVEGAHEKVSLTKRARGGHVSHSDHHEHHGHGTHIDIHHHHKRGGAVRRASGGKVTSEAGNLKSPGGNSGHEGESAPSDLRGARARGGHITAAKRRALPSSDFALPGHGTGPEGKGSGSYPIDTAARARNALARGAQHATGAELAQIKRRVHTKYPGIGKS